MSTSAISETSSRPRWLARWSIAALLFYWLVLITTTHIPKVPDPLGFRPSDKLLHFMAYTILGALVGLVSSRYVRPRLGVAVVLFVGLAVHGVLDEVTQPLFGRHADAADWIADILGAAAGLGLFFAASTFVQRWRSVDEKLAGKANTSGNG